MKNMNGWSQMNWTTFTGRAMRKATRAVAAAASDPSSFTSMKALCVAASNFSPGIPLKPEKSAANESNMSVKPILTKTCKSNKGRK